MKKQQIKTPIIYAIKHHNHEIVRSLLDNNAYIDFSCIPISIRKKSLLYYIDDKLNKRKINDDEYCSQCYNSTCEELLKHKKHPHLFRIVQFEQNYLLKYLINRGMIDIEKKFHNFSPLIYAIMSGNLKAVAILCSAGSLLVDLHSSPTFFDLHSSPTIFDFLKDRLKKNFVKGSSKECYETIITHARSKQRLDDPIRNAVELLLIFKNQYSGIPKELQSIVLAKLLPDVNINDIKEKLSRELFIITSKDPFLDQVNNRIKYLQDILKKSKETTYELRLEHDFNEFIAAFSGILNSDLLITTLESKLNSNNLALKIYKNCTGLIH